MWRLTVYWEDGQPSQVEKQKMKEGLFTVLATSFLPSRMSGRGGLVAEVCPDRERHRGAIASP